MIMADEYFVILASFQWQKTSIAKILYQIFIQLRLRAGPVDKDNKIFRSIMDGHMRKYSTCAH